MPVIYDQIGGGYAHHRKPEPRLARIIEDQLRDCASVVNVGAGAGSYEPCNCRLAVEPSSNMIRQRAAGAAPCVQAAAEALPLASQSFEGALVVLSMHHWTDVAAGLRELRRVARKRIVIVTWDRDARYDFWLARDYLPQILTFNRRRYPGITDLGAALGGNCEAFPFPVPADCQDGFTGAYWKRPWAYLDPGIRQSISSIAQLDQGVVAPAIEKLRTDLESGEWVRRNGHLDELESMDLGYRIVVSSSIT